MSAPDSATESFSALINDAPIGVYVVDADFRVRLVNHAARPAFANVPDVIGRDLAEALRIIWPPDRSGAVIDHFRHTLQTGEPFDAPDDSLVRHDSGLTEYYAWQIRRVSMPNGRYGVVCYFRDTATHAAAQQSTRWAQRQLSFVMDAMPQKIWTATPDAAIDYLNTQWLEFTGLQFEEIRNWARTGFIHPDDLAHTFADWTRGFEMGTAIQIEHRFQRADGEYRWHISRCIPMRNAAGQIEMWVGSSTDIHDQKVTAELLRHSGSALVEADRRKDEFLATLAHELRNPLAPISNALQVLELAEDNSSTAKLAKSIIQRQVLHMTRLVDELLDLSRITRGTIDLRAQTIDLNLVLQQAVETSRPAIQHAQHELVVTFGADPLYLHGDAVRLVQVFGNLLNNAAKYSNPGGCIWISVERTLTEAVISVKDTGLGIPAGMLQSVFEIFSQVDHSLERSRGGLGIGLSLVQRLVALHNGSVQAFSDGLGHGSEFVVRLPVLVAAEVTDVDVEITPVLLPIPRRRVLVADDNRDAADSLATYLQLLGHETRTAYDGAEAVDIALEFRPELIIIDLGMPKLNGYEAARRIRQQPQGERMSIIALSGWGQRDDRRKSADAGMNEHFVKPLDHLALSKLLAELPV